MSSRIPSRLRRSVQEMPGGPAAFIARGKVGEEAVAPPALLLHGFAGDLLTWQFALLALAGQRRVIAVDLPGHGESTLDVGSGLITDQARWLLGFMDAQDIARAHLVGHSMGGAIAIALAGLSPHRVASLSLVAPAGLGPQFDLDFLLDLIRLPEGGGPGATELAMRLFARDSVIAPRMAPRVGELIAGQMQDPARRAALAKLVGESFVPAFHGQTTRPDLTNLGVPAQILWGRQDTVIPVPAEAALPASIPLHLFDGAGHMPHSEVPGPVVRCLSEFMSGVDAQIAPPTNQPAPHSGVPS